MPSSVKSQWEKGQFSKFAKFRGPLIETNTCSTKKVEGEYCASIYSTLSAHVQDTFPVAQLEEHVAGNYMNRVRVSDKLSLIFFQFNVFFF